MFDRKYPRQQFDMGSGWEVYSFHNPSKRASLIRRKRGLIAASWAISTHEQALILYYDLGLPRSAELTGILITEASQELRRERMKNDRHLDRTELE